ncbi:MAG TPA: TIM barrel protein [Chloroflexota bacterium]|nr:TIM barrel protein [Chloroflexota bacterium]
MRLAIGIGTILQATGRGIYEQPEQAAKVLRWWKKQGAEGLVFYDSLPDFYRVPVDRFKALKNVLDEVGLPVAGFNALRKSLFMPDLADIDERRLNQCLEVCSILGGTFVDVSVNVPIPTGLDPMAFSGRTMFRGEHASVEAYASAATRLKSYAQACSRLGIDVSIELHDDGLQDTADNCLKLVALIDEPNVGVNPDLGNWYRVPYQQTGSWRDQVVKLAPKTNYWEVKNFKRVISPNDGRYYSWSAELDEGDIDFREATVVLWKAGFRGWVCNEGGNGDRVRSGVRYLTYMRWILDEWIPEVAT